MNIVIICREQSKVYMRNHELDFKPSDHQTSSSSSRTHFFANEAQQFHVKLQLFAASTTTATQQSTSNLNNNLVEDDHILNVNTQINNNNENNQEDEKEGEEEEEDGTIEVGEMVRLNALVRSGDGWNYAYLKDVKISRRIGNKKKRNSHRYSNDAEDESIDLNDQIQLVNEYGCRNLKFESLAPSNPYQQNNNGLDVNFEFRAFIFENMDIKHDRLRISTKIVACQQLDDCRPVSFILKFNILIIYLIKLIILKKKRLIVKIRRRKDENDQIKKMKIDSLI